MVNCELCGDEVLWHHGNGGQWIGLPPRDWMHCHGRTTNPTHHQVSMPISLEPDDVRTWLLNG